MQINLLENDTFPWNQQTAGSWQEDCFQGQAEANLTPI